MNINSNIMFSQSNSNKIHCIVIDPIPDYDVMFEVLVCLFHVLLGQHHTGLPLWKYCVVVLIVIHYIA